MESIDRAGGAGLCLKKFPEIPNPFLKGRRLFEIRTGLGRFLRVFPLKKYTQEMRDFNVLACE